MTPQMCIFVLLVGLGACNTVCPDGSLCNTGGTCCELSSGKYSCCPLPNAVCCKDQEHCCPSGYACDNETDACKPPGIMGVPRTAFLSQALGSTRREPSSNYVVCGAQSEAVCPSSHTCCSTGEGAAANHSCCPSRDGVCCADGRHCCPQRTACDLAAQRCIYNDAFDAPETRTMLLSPAKPTKKNRMTSVEQGARAGYSDDSECPQGFYSCGYIDYCCPLGTMCADDRCLPMSRSVQQSIVPCRDGKSHCPDGYTCCQTPSGSYSCCPLEDAVCCDDNIHCCPKGTQCDTDRGACRRAASSEHVPWNSKVAATVS